MINLIFWIRGEDSDGDNTTSALVAKQCRQWWRCDVGDGGVTKTSMVEMQRHGWWWCTAGRGWWRCDNGDIDGVWFFIWVGKWKVYECLCELLKLSYHRPLTCKKWPYSSEGKIVIHRPRTWGEGKIVISQATNVKTLMSVSQKIFFFHEQ